MPTWNIYGIIRRNPTESILLTLYCQTLKVMANVIYIFSSRKEMLSLSFWIISKRKKIISKESFQGAWVTPSGECLILAQVMITRYVSLSPTSDSVLTGKSLEPASHSVFLSLCPNPTRTLSLSVSYKVNKC